MPPATQEQNAIGATEPVHHADFSFLSAHTETTSQAIAAFLLLDKVPDMDLLRRRVFEELNRSFRRFTQIAVRNPTPQWATPARFDVADHVFLRRLPEVTDLTSLMAEATREFSTPLDMAWPLWRMVVIAGPEEASPVTGLLFLVHHSLTDGLGLLEALYAFCGDQVKPSRDTGDGEEEMASDWGGATTTSGRAAIAAKCVRQILFETLSPPISSPLNGPNSSVRIGCLVRMPRNDLRRIGRKLGGSLPRSTRTQTRLRGTPSPALARSCTR